MKKTNTSQIFFCFRQNPFGAITVFWSVHQGKPKLCRILLSNSEVSVKKMAKSSFALSIPSTCTEIVEITNDIEAFLNGENIQFSLEMINMELCSDFQQKVLCAEHGIPRGYISSYQRLARWCLGRPHGARAVGNALANNPFPIIIPCHRTIRSDRTLGDYQGGLEMKRALLEMEDIGFDDTGHVEVNNPFWPLILLNQTI